MKPLDEGYLFENKIRTLFRSLGFSEVPNNHTVEALNNFYLGGQEIDAFGIIDGFFVVVDIKTRKAKSEHPSKGITKFLNTINGYKESVIADIKTKYLKKYGYRGEVFIFWNEHLKLDSSHLDIAKKNNIALRDDVDAEHYQKAFDTLQNSEVVRNWFLKDLTLQLKNLTPFQLGISIGARAIKTTFGSRTLYTFPLDIKNLLKLSYVFRTETNTLLVESYQRLLKKNKLSKMKRFIQGESGYFPNNLIAVSEEKLVFNPDQNIDPNSTFIPGKIDLPAKPCYLEILDGQHRLYCYSAMEKYQESNCLWITVVDNLDSAEKTSLFVKINATQTPVPSYLIWDLCRFVDPLSDNAKIATFVYKLNEQEPFEDKIALPRVRSTNSYLSFSNLCSCLASRTNLFSKYGSNKDFMKVFTKYFMEIFEHPILKEDWKRCINHKGKKGFIGTNNSISVLLRLLVKILNKTGLPKRDRIDAWKAKLSVWIIEAVIGYLYKNKTEDANDPYKNLRKLTSEKARKDAAELIWEESPLSNMVKTVQY